MPVSIFLLGIDASGDSSHGSVVKNPPANAGDIGSILGLGRSSGEGNGNPLHYSCLGSPMDREAWRATVQGVAELDVMEHACGSPLGKGKGKVLLQK